MEWLDRRGVIRVQNGDSKDDQMWVTSDFFFNGVFLSRKAVAG